LAQALLQDLTKNFASIVLGAGAKER